MIVHVLMLVYIHVGKDDFLTDAIPIEACQLACMYLPHIGASRKNSRGL